MADTDTTTVSLALYRYLCQNIVGSENHVKTIRLLNNVRDDVLSNSRIATITSGSFGEGLEMKGSDLDMMLVAKICEVYEDENTRLNPNNAHFRMETDDVKPGFSQLLLKNNILQYFLFQYRDEFNGNLYLSSALFKQHHLQKKENNVHGPCISDKAGYFDIAFCLHCKTWISQASQWISRSNNSWPSDYVKQSIIKHGVLYVPIGVKGSPKEDIEWRISFSVGEKLLISTFTHTQLICYALLKILLKDVIATFSECSDLLCSYFIKTIIFWISEELPKKIWKPINLIPCFMRCLNRLIYCVKYSTCLHYFIPENNLFENKIEGRSREMLLDKLNTLHSYGWRCVLFSDQLSNFHESLPFAHIEPNTLHSNEIAKTLNSSLLHMANYIIVDNLRGETYLYRRIIDQIVSCYQPSLKYLYTYYMSWWCGQYAQSIPLHSKRRKYNKHLYKQHNACLCTLLQNIHHDAVSGWLMLASLFYQSKQFSKALHILAYSLSKFTSEKLFRSMDMSDIHYQMLKLKSFQEKNIVRLWKIMLVNIIKFERYSWLIPNELKMEVQNGGIGISSIVYATFLQFLCHYHLNDVRQCQDCLNTLQLVIADNYFIENDLYLQSKAYNLLGIALKMSGDHEAARQSFMQSVEIYPDHNLNISMKRLLLMSSF